MKKVFRRFPLIAAGLIFALVLVEIYFRFFFPFTQGGLWFVGETPYQYDETVGLRYKPNGRWQNSDGVVIQTNSLGFRSSQPYHAESDSLRVIAIIGDSYVSGNQVVETVLFTTQLDALLPDDVQAQNYGIDGIGLTNYIALYRQFVRPQHPGIVVVTISAANDLMDTSPDFQLIPELIPQYQYDDDGMPVDVIGFPGPPQRLNRRVHYALLRYTATYRVVDLLKKNTARRDENGIPHLYFMYEDPRREPYQHVWEFSEWALRTLIHEIRQDGALPIVVLVSYPIETDDQKWAEAAAEFAAVYDVPLNRDLIRADFEALTAELGVAFIDMSIPMREAFHAGQPIFVSDGHLSAEGHQLVADAIYDFLQDSALP